MLRDYLRLPRIVWYLSAGTLVNRAGTVVIVYLTLYAKRELGFPEGLATRALTAFGAGSVVAAILGGWLADRIGRRPVMLLSLASGAAILLFMGSVRNVWGFLGIVFVYSSVMEMYRPAFSATISDVVPPKDRPFAFNLQYVAINVGFAIGASCGALLAEVSYQWLFIFDAATTGIFALIVFFAIPETRPASRPLSEALPQDARGGGFRRILSDRLFLLLSFAFWLHWLVFTQSFNTLPLHLDRLGFRERVYGWSIALNGVIIVLFQLPLADCCQRFDRLRVVSIGFAVVVAGLSLYTVATKPVHFAAIVLVWTLGEMLIAVFFWTIVADLAPADLRGRYNGVAGVSIALATGIGAPLGGAVLEAYGPTALWASVTGVGVLSLFVFGAISGAIRRRVALANEAETCSSHAAPPPLPPAAIPPELPDLVTEEPLQASAPRTPGETS